MIHRVFDELRAEIGEETTIKVLVDLDFVNYKNRKGTLKDSVLLRTSIDDPLIICTGRKFTSKDFSCELNLHVTIAHSESMLIPVSWASPNLPSTNPSLEEDFQLAKESLAFLHVMKEKMMTFQRRMYAGRMTSERVL